MGDRDRENSSSEVNLKCVCCAADSVVRIRQWWVCFGLSPGRETGMTQIPLPYFQCILNESRPTCTLYTPISRVHCFGRLIGCNFKLGGSAGILHFTHSEANIDFVVRKHPALITLLFWRHICSHGKINSNCATKVVFTFPLWFWSTMPRSWCSFARNRAVRIN